MRKVASVLFPVHAVCAACAFAAEIDLAGTWRLKRAEHNGDGAC